MTNDKQIIVSEPKQVREGVTEAGVGVELSLHGVAISNFESGEAWDTVYVPREDVPELQKALTELVAE